MNDALAGLISSVSSSAIRDIGFPIVVSLWFMWRTDKKLEKVLELLIAQSKDIIEIKKDVDPD